MLNDPLGWFPSPLFNNLFLWIFIGVYAVDYIVPRFTNPNYQRKSLASDNGSYLVILIAIFLEISLSIYFRMHNIGTLAGAFQWLGLILMVAGAAFRQWALIHLGRFFSRTVQIESEHKVISTGPYRWIRHPAYTGMIAVYTGLSMAIGTWLGTLTAFVVVTASLLYRIRVEERALLTALGNEYREYRQQTWQLFPGW
ncbi:MAG TPA: isoprenylcysteine carboxylmethyltransferase family protein [Anaerolineales bacterium]|nr:isoprenylcysteine carboxylmethyltransferase family protein [Anaerolineales bacterium]